MKKIFTLLTMVFMAIGVNAQTTYDLKGLSVSDFTLGSDFADGGTWEDKKGEYGGDAGKAYPCITYTKKDKSNWSDLVLTGTPIVFQFKNKDKKDQFYRLFPNFFYSNGKDSRITITGVTAGQKVTLLAAGKNDTGCLFSAVENCKADEANPTTAVGKQMDPSAFTALTFIALNDGNITIAETSAGYHLASITIEDGGVGPVNPTEATAWNFTELSSADEENLTSDDANWAYDVEKERYSYIPSFTSSEGKANNIVLKANDAELNIIKGLLFGRDGSIDTKKFSIDKGKGINFGGGKYRMIIPDLVKDDIIKVRFAGSSEGDRGITLSNVGTDNSANSTDKETVESTFTVEKNGSVIIETTGGLTIIALAVNDNLPETSGIKVINAEVISNGATYNLGGQHVNDSYHGVVIKNGKKIVKK